MIQTSRFDNIHVLLWLIKDTCWMLEWRFLGTAMIVPTIAVAVYIASRTSRDTIFWVNLAICFWITANAYWMVCEFLEFEDFKNLAGIPFSLGLVSMVIYYTRPAYSARSAITGSTLAARRAGIRLAAKTTSPSTPATDR